MSKTDNKCCIIDAMCGIDTASPQICQFTENFDSIKFLLDDDFEDYTFMIITDINGHVEVITTDSETLTRENDSETGNAVLIWKPESEITASSGILIYQIAAYKNIDNQIESVWYSKEGRLIVTESISTTSHSAAVIGSKPNLLTKLILELAKATDDINSLTSQKVDKEDGRGLSDENYSLEEKEKLEKISEGAEVNVQSDWSETNEDSDSFIKNKPTIDQSYNPDSANAQSGTAVKEAVTQGVAEIVGGAPEMLDTLKEIADAISNDENAFQTIMSVITNEIDGVNEALRYKLSMSDVDINLNTESYKPVANAAVSSAVDDLFHQVNDNCLKKGEAHEIYTPRTEFNETTTDIRFEIEALKNNGSANGFDVQYLDKASTSFKDYVSGDANTPAKILRSVSGGKGILLSSYTENEVDGFAGTTGFLIDMDGRMYKRRYSRFTGKPEHDWEEIVTESDIVRSIESSLDEIIKKYGLDGEAV